MRIVVLAVEEVHVVGGHQFEIKLPRQGNELRLHLQLRLHAMIMKLHVKILLPEDIAQFLHRFPRLVDLSLQQPLIDGARNAPTETDDPIRVLA